MRAGIYVRLSVDRDGTKDSPKRQIEDCRHRCEAEGWEVVEVYEDRDISAFRPGVRRPAFERLLADVRARRLDVVVVWKIDRITRQGLRVIGSILDALDEGSARLVSATEAIDTESAVGEMILGVIASIARSESENISRRVSRANQQAAEEGRFHGGGHRQFGYNRDGTINGNEASDLELAARSIEDGVSLRATAALINSLGSRTTAGNEWTASGLSSSLRSPGLRGVREHRGTLHPGKWQPVFQEARHLNLIRLLDDRKGRRRPGNRYLLTGIARCGVCGEALYLGKQTNPNGSAFIKYICKKGPGLGGCGSVAISQTSTDRFVVEEMLKMLSDAAQQRQSVETDHDTEIERLDHQVDQDRSALDRLADDFYLHRTVGRDTYERLRLELEQRINENVSRAERISTDAVSLDWSIGSKDPLAVWNSWDMRPRRDVLRPLLDRLIIHPAKHRGGNVFDTSRIEIVWKSEA